MCSISSRFEAARPGAPSSITCATGRARPSNSHSGTATTPSQDNEIDTKQLIRKLLPNKHILPADKDSLGRWGEKRCEKFLKRKGLKTLTRNFSCKTGEIDLIMVDSDGTLVFVEVKTRASEDFSASESAVTKTKQTRMYRAARYFLATNNIENRPFRFDVVTIVPGEKGPVPGAVQGGPEQIRHYENAFVP